MGDLAIVLPLTPLAIGGTLEGAARLASASPFEAAVSGGAGPRTVDVDFGAAVQLDTLFLGHTTMGDGDYFIASGGDSYDKGALGHVEVAPSRLARRRRHLLLVLPQPTTLRYLRLTAYLPAGTEIGVFAAGLAFRPALAQEWGSGRFVTDTGVATRTAGGGFGFSPGARAGGWQWTLGDLSPTETDALYGLQLDAGGTAMLLVIEDSRTTPGLNERCHWCRLTKLDPYERRSVGRTRWDMRVEDWASGASAVPATPA